ncbi:MAG: SH3 domain-containing protein [Chloroflexi bacterium]|nr:SH3 domain-containing protein [Chloroflexota bacterium]
MIEPSQRRWTAAPTGVDRLGRRVAQRRARHQWPMRLIRRCWHQIRHVITVLPERIRQLPSRLVLHIIVIGLIPIAVALGSLPTGDFQGSAPARIVGESLDLSVPLVPLSAVATDDLGDAPLDDSSEVPVPLSLVSRSEALAPVVVAGQVTAGRIFLRDGPGTEYDAVGRISAGTELQVIGRYGDWFQVRERIDAPVYWAWGELLTLPDSAIYTLFEVQADRIPPPPPPKIGTVAEGGLLLRDGPGTGYVPMESLDNGATLELFEIYQDWYHVGTGSGLDGWVKSEFITVDPSIVERLLVAESIPDPNPALVGTIGDGEVNLRKGPDTRYEKVGVVTADTPVDLIGKHKDWLRVGLADGTRAWVFRDLVNVSDHVVRRVPASREFPALPMSAGRMGASPGLSRIAASGDVASYAVQFVGYRYVWGGTSPSRGFDCSGLMQYVYRQFGVGIPRLAASQFSTSVGASVGAMGNLAPGDLMFFVNTDGRRGISHVAMYIGDGRMVHAMSPRYGVQVSGIWNDYWTARYVGGIRVRR